jgi:Uma2 family endonuclease
MATQQEARCTLEEYLELEDTLDYRSEFHDGLILPVEAASPMHARLGLRMGGVLQTAFPSCAVYDSSPNLYIASANKVLHPDATVLCGEENRPKPDCIDNPTVLVEVTSLKTKDYDYGTKREMYFILPSLRYYLLVSQTEAKVGVYERKGVGWFYVDRGPEETITLDGKEIRVADIYYPEV